MAISSSEHYSINSTGSNSISTSGVWTDCSSSSPCLICGKTSYCSFKEDKYGTVAKCRKVKGGEYKHDTDRLGDAWYHGVHPVRGRIPGWNPAHDPDGNWNNDGGRLYLRNTAAAQAPSQATSSHKSDTDTDPSRIEKGDAATLDAVYRAFLSSLSLDPQHKADLTRRGLSDDQIKRGGFRSVPGENRISISRGLASKFGRDAILSTPGFCYDSAKMRFSCSGKDGYFIPIRDADGKIQALQIRLDDPTGGAKYVSFSSARKLSDGKEGPSPGSPFASPVGPNGETFNQLNGVSAIRVTEGILKAYIATALSGIPTLGIPGVGTWEAFVNWFKERYPDPANAPILEVAFDADAPTNSAVAGAVNNIVAHAVSAGYRVHLLTWPESAGKGIDDVLLAGNVDQIKIFKGVPAKHEADRILQSAKAADKAKRDAEQQEKINGLISAYQNEGGLQIFRDEERLSTLYDIHKHDPIGFNTIKKIFQKSGDVKDALSIIKEYETRLAAQKNKVVSMSGRPIDGDSSDNPQTETIPLGGIDALRPIRECLFGSADAGTTDPSTTEPENQAHKAARESCPIPTTIGCPPAYKISMGGGILLKSENPDSLPQAVSRRPVVPIHRYIDTATGLEQVKITWFESSGNYWKSTIVPRSVAASAQKILTVADNGLPVSSDNALALCKWLMAVIVENPSIPITETTSKFGWIGSPGGAFLLGCDVITAKASSNPQGGTIPEPTTTGPRIQFDSGSEPENANLARSLEPRGSFEGWQEMATEATAESPLGAVVMAASFAAPLLSLLDLPGFVIELAGATSQGKTITTKCAASVWGNPEPAARAHYLNTWNLTAVALERLLGTLNHLPVILDDTQQAPKKMDLPEKIYHIAGGQGRGRGAKNPGSRQHVETWQTIGISSGEQPITGFGAEGGAVARSIILWCSGKLFPRFNAEQADRIQAAAQDHYGHAGRRFIQWIVDNPTDAKRRIRDEYDRAKRRIIESGDGSGVLSRISGYLAIVEAAAIMAGEVLGIDGLARGVVSDEVIRLASLEAAKANRADEALEVAWRWANLESERFWNNDAENKDEFFPVGGWAGRMDWTVEEIESWPEPVKDRAVTMLAFNPDALRGYLARIGYQDYEAIVRTWADRGYIETDKDRASRLTKKIKIRGASARYVVMARATIERLSGIDPNELEENDILGPIAG